VLIGRSSKKKVYVQNKLSHSALGFKTQEEMFSRKKPEVSHHKIFGYPIFVHIPKEKRTKLFYDLYFVFAFKPSLMPPISISLSLIPLDKYYEVKFVYFTIIPKFLID
jgi:hypothetical protein